MTTIHISITNIKRGNRFEFRTIRLWGSCNDYRKYWTRPFIHWLVKMNVMWAPGRRKAMRSRSRQNTSVSRMFTQRIANRSTFSSNLIRARREKRSNIPSSFSFSFPPFQPFFSFLLQFPSSTHSSSLIFHSFML